jgi:hypothetical protein
VSACDKRKKSREKFEFVQRIEKKYHAAEVIKGPWLRHQADEVMES